MRIVTPLFCFGFDGGKEFTFTSRPYRIVEFGSGHRDMAGSVELFSRQDVESMKDVSCVSWALTADVDDMHAYKAYRQGVNLLLMAFKIYLRSEVLVKYHLCEEDVNLCRRLNDTITELVPREDAMPSLNVTEGHLALIDTAFTKLLNMERVSDRTHNALYFLFRGLCAQKMIDAFVYLMMVLESLFSKDDQKAAKRAVCFRTSALLGNQKDCTYDDQSTPIPAAGRFGNGSNLRISHS
jgi:hypothetical protein